MKSPVNHERGLEISAVAVVDVTQSGAYIVSVEQTPPTPDLKRAQDDATRIDQAIEQLKKARKSFSSPQSGEEAVKSRVSKIELAEMMNKA